MRILSLPRITINSRYIIINWLGYELILKLF